MRTVVLPASITMVLALLVASMTGCGSSSVTAVVPPSTTTPTITPAPQQSQITDIHLFAFLRTDGSTSGGPAPMSQQQLQAARRAAKINYAMNRETAITVDPAVNVYVWAFGNRQGWLPVTERKITGSPGAYTSVHLSANDSSVVFSTVVNGYNQIFTGTVPAEGQTMAQPIQLTSDMEHHRVPHVSSDGSKVVFTKFDATSNGDVVCVINNSIGASEACLDFSATTPVLKGANIWHASWSPNGKLFFEAWGGPLNSDDIFMVNADGSGLTQITNNAGTKNYDECPSVYSNGTWMVVDTWNDTNQSYNITTIDLNSKQRQTISENGYSWDPLATYYTIVWVSQLATDSRPQLYLDMLFDVGRLTNNAYANYFENGK